MRDHDRRVKAWGAPPDQRVRFSWPSATTPEILPLVSPRSWVGSVLVLMPLIVGCHSCPEPAHAATEWSSAPHGYASAQPPAPAPVRSEEAWLHQNYGSAPAVDTLSGKAVYYGDSLAGHLTANGETYEPTRFTAAHKKLPFNTVVRVVRLDNGRHTVVRITDRGPFGKAERIIDLSRIAAERLDMIRAGVVDVRVEILRYGDGARVSSR